MFDRTTKFSSESGLTLVELLVVVLVIVIVASVAFLNRGSANEQFQRQNSSRQLKESFERGRFDSVKRRADGVEPFASVEIRSDRFILTTYSKEANGTATAKVKETLVPQGVVIAHYASGTLPMTITFNRRGETAGGLAQFRICNGSCSSPNNSNSDIVLVTTTGTVNLLPGGETIPAFSDPPLIGNPSASDTINNKVVMP